MTTAIPLNTASGCDQATTSIDRPVDWRQLTWDIRAGDHDAFSIYYEHFFDLVFCEVRRLSGRDEATCLDIVQETFVKVVKFNALLKSGLVLE